MGVQVSEDNEEVMFSTTAPRILADELAKKEFGEAEFEGPCKCIWEADRRLWGSGGMMACAGCRNAAVNMQCPRGWAWYGWVMGCAVDEHLASCYGTTRTWEDPEFPTHAL
jgi:hypothetical protein